MSSTGLDLMLDILTLLHTIIHKQTLTALGMDGNNGTLLERLKLRIIILGGCNLVLTIGDRDSDIDTHIDTYIHRHVDTHIHRYPYR